MASTLLQAPDKIAGQHTGAQAEEGIAAEAEAAAQASRVVLTAEDEAIFCATTYTAPGFLLRGLMRGIAAQDSVTGASRPPLPTITSSGSVIPDVRSTPPTAANPLSLIHDGAGTMTVTRAIPTPKTPSAKSVVLPPLHRSSATRKS